MRSFQKPGDFVPGASESHKAVLHAVFHPVCRTRITLKGNGLRNQHKLARFSCRPIHCGNGHNGESCHVPSEIVINVTRLDKNEMIARALKKVGLEPSMEASGGGSDANVFIENGVTALPVGIGVHSFHTKEETAVISEALKGAEVCEQIITGY